MTEHEKLQEIMKIKDPVPLPLDDGRSGLIVVYVQRYFARSEYPFAQVIEKIMPNATSGYFERINSHRDREHPALTRGIPLAAVTSDLSGRGAVS